MASPQVIRATVERAVASAVVDAAAPPDERCRFDPAALEAVMQLCTSGHQRDAVIAAADEVMQRSVVELDAAGTLAAMTLVVRVEAATEQRLIPVENLQGDVGAGYGQVTYDG